MPISLMPLPYSHDALAPAISADTLEVHHGKHHKGYVDKTNALIAGTDLADQPLEAIISAARNGGDTKVFNQAAQVWNHGFYWLCLTPDQTEPSADLAGAISASFGSREALVSSLIEAAAAQFGSGWAWLVASGDRLSIETTPNAAQPLGRNSRPLLVVDVWEHAYYLDRKNDRKAYLDAACQRLDWRFASENFARQTVWTYPSS
jgi:Fe-Mn family superoxide dismutase